MQLQKRDPGGRRNPALHLRATRDLRYIRRTMERASSFTALPGRGVMGMGALAIVAAPLCYGLDGWTWTLAWLLAACIAVGLGTYATWRKAGRAGVSLGSGPGRRFFVSLVPPLFAGLVLTPVLARAGLIEDLPGAWMLLYGVAILTGGAFAVRPVLAMGGSFAGLGCAALFVPGLPADLWMALGFGGLHLVFGWWIARRLGG